MPGYYAQALGPTLHSYVESNSLGSTSNDVFLLNQELETARASCLLAVQKYGQIYETLQTDKNVSESQRNSLLACGMVIGQQIVQSMQRIAEISEKAHKIQINTSSNISVAEVDLIVRQLLHIMHRVCGDKYAHVAVAFDEEVKKTLRLPTTVNETPGSVISPDKALEMMAGTMLTVEPLRIE